MSRQSSDEIKDGRLINGYDYENQAWVVGGCYIGCGHPVDMVCNCFGRKHCGEETRSQLGGVYWEYCNKIK